MTEETLAKYKALLESGAISREEFDRMTAEEQPEQSAVPDPAPDQPDGLASIRNMKGCCAAVMSGSVLTLILSFVCIPPKPHFSEYDIGNAFLYLFGLGFWFLRGIAGCSITFGLSLYAYGQFRKAGTETNYAMYYRGARTTLIWSAVLLAVIILHQYIRYGHPLGTP